MRTFTTLSGPAAALPMINVDTDQLIPKQYLTAISRAGLGKGLFHDFRYDMEDKEVPEFVLNRAPWREAGILIAGPELRLRVEPRARPLGARGFRHPLRDRAELR